MNRSPRHRQPFIAVLVIAAALTCAHAPAAAQTKTGTTIGQFLLIEPSARFTGMGNAGSAVLSGIDGVYYNPAAVAAVETWAFTFSHSEWLADIRYDYIAAAMPLGRWGKGYMTVTSLGSGDIEVRTVDQPLGTGERFAVSNIAIGFGYGRAITDRFSVGGGVVWSQETIWHSSASVMTLNLGTLYRVAENGLHIGSSLTHFGTDGDYSGRDLRILFDNDPDRFGDNSALPAEQFTDPFAVPVLFRLGLGLPIRPNPSNVIQLAVDAFHPSDNTESVSFGAEWAWKENLALRAGWQNLMMQDSEVGLTLGAGLAGRIDDARYRLDYAWADHGRLGSTQRFSFGLGF
jgi:long-subunit fatty acid transport protein